MPGIFDQEKSNFEDFDIQISMDVYHSYTQKKIKIGDFKIELSWVQNHPMLFDIPFLGSKL